MLRMQERSWYASIGMLLHGNWHDNVKGKVYGVLKTGTRSLRFPCHIKVDARVRERSE